MPERPGKTRAPGGARCGAPGPARLALVSQGLPRRWHPPGAVSRAVMRPAGKPDARLDRAGRPACIGRPGAAYTPLAQALHLVAAAGMVSLQKGHSLVGGAGGAGAGFSSAFVMRNTTSAMITKSMTLPMNAP